MSLLKRLSLPRVTVDVYLDPDEAVQGDSNYIHPSKAEHPLTLSVSDLEQDVNPSLQRRIRGSAVAHANGGDFWPPKLLHEILSVQNVVEELNRFASQHPSHHNISDHEDLAVKIKNGYSKIFAMLCLLDMSGCIRDCIDENVKDTDLPFIVYAKADYRLSRAVEPGKTLKCFQESSFTGVWWRPHDREYISTHQERFSPVIFGFDANGQAQHFTLSSGAVLPFKQPSHRSDTQHGGFATVDQVEVHPYCHRFHDILPSINTKNVFARKQLNPHFGRTESQLKQEFEKEISILNRFSELKHGNLVKLLASWTQSSNYVREYCLLFPLANGDLDWYWTNQSMSDTTIQWISRQILGLSDALRKIHDSPLELLKPEGERKFGRHGDLKPENILWYDSPEDSLGILVIADIGASAVNSMWGRSGVQNRAIQHTPRYKPPECDLEGGSISRSYDIWTFGCILLELVCWCLEGKRGRARFEDERYALYPTGVRSDMFFDIKPASDGRFVVLVKESVTNTIARLHRHPSCTLYFHEMLYLIEEEMIVTLSSDTNRITSAKLYQALALMEERLNRDSNYHTRACPMPRLARRFDPVDAVFQSHQVEQIQERVQGLQAHMGPTQRTKSVQELMHIT